MATDRKQLAHFQNRLLAVLKPGQSDQLKILADELANLEANEQAVVFSVDWQKPFKELPPREQLSSPLITKLDAKPTTMLKNAFKEILGSLGRIPLDEEASQEKKDLQSAFQLMADWPNELFLECLPQAMAFSEKPYLMPVVFAECKKRDLEAKPYTTQDPFLDTPFLDKEGWLSEFSQLDSKTQMLFCSAFSAATHSPQYNPIHWLASLALTTPQTQASVFRTVLKGNETVIAKLYPRFLEGCSHLNQDERTAILLQEEPGGRTVLDSLGFRFASKLVDILPQLQLREEDSKALLTKALHTELQEGDNLDAVLDLTEQHLSEAERQSFWTAHVATLIQRLGTIKIIHLLPKLPIAEDKKQQVIDAYQKLINEVLQEKYLDKKQGKDDKNLKVIFSEFNALPAEKQNLILQNIPKQPLPSASLSTAKYRKKERQEALLAESTPLSLLQTVIINSEYSVPSSLQTYIDQAKTLELPQVRQQQLERMQSMLAGNTLEAKLMRIITAMIDRRSSSNGLNEQIHRFQQILIQSLNNNGLNEQARGTLLSELKSAKLRNYHRIDPTHYFHSGAIVNQKASIQTQITNLLESSFDLSENIKEALAEQAPEKLMALVNQLGCGGHEFLEMAIQSRQLEALRRRSLAEREKIFLSPLLKKALIVAIDTEQVAPLLAEVALHENKEYLI